MPASITLTVSHLASSTSFFLSALHPLNYVYRGRVNDTIGFGHPDAAPDFWITQSIPGVPPGPAHVAFPAASRAHVHDFFHTALKAGGRVHGEPALRDDCGYYSAAIIDFDGNSIEAVFRPDLLEDNKTAVADNKTVVSTTKSVAKSKASTVVSSASKAAPSMAPSKAPSRAAPSVAAQSSAAKSSAPSKAPSQVASVAPSKAPSKAPSQAPSQAASQVARSVAVSEAPARTTISRAPTAPAAPQGSGNSFVDMINEAKGTVAFAREMVNQTRPLLDAPSTPSAGPGAGSAVSADSHGPSDAIVGTLLGVAAGAALHYAFSNRNKANETASAPVTPPEPYQQAFARSETAPSYSEERYYYYYHTPQQQRALPAPSRASTYPYAIEAPPSEVSRASGASKSGQRLMIEMVDNDPSLSEVAPSAVPTTRPRRRSSFSGMSAARTTASRAKSGVKMLEGAAPPPTSYRGPTVVTDAGRSSHHSTTGSSTSSSHRRRHRSSSASATSRRKRDDEGYASAGDDRGSETTVTAVRRSPTTPSQVPLPSSRPASHSGDDQSFYSTHSKAHKTVIGRLTEKQLHKLEEGGRFEKGNTDVTRSVIGKVKEVDKLNVSRGELGPSDSVSQVSSTRGSSRRSRH